MPGILNYGPGLEIIDLIVNKKVKNINILRKKFSKGKINKGISNRLRLNILSGFIKLKNEKLQLTKISKIMIDFFEIIKKSFKLKSDAF